MNFNGEQMLTSNSLALGAFRILQHISSLIRNAWERVSSLFQTRRRLQIARNNTINTHGREELEFFLRDRNEVRTIDSADSVRISANSLPRVEEKHGSYPNIRANDGAKRIFEDLESYEFQNFNKDILPRIRTLVLNYPEQINAVSTCGMTFSLWAAYSKNTPALYEIINMGANLNMRDFRGKDWVEALGVDSIRSKDDLVRYVQQQEKTVVSVMPNL